MKKMKKINLSKLFATASLSLIAASPILAQSNLGASCGCPAVASRPLVYVSTLPGYVAISGTFGGELTQGATFTCDKTYILDKKIYIPASQTLNIAPGTVIKGAANSVPAEATALTIMRGGKINAMGTESCPIVFTAAADPMNGSYAISNVGKWGGVVILGKASNNLTLAANGPFVPGGSGKLAVADGLGTVEGFASSNPQDQYGVATSIPSSYASGTSPATTTYTFDQVVTAGASAASTITLGANSLYVQYGMSVTGTGIAVGATVVGVNTQTGVITLSAANTAAVSGNATFTGTFPLAASTTGLFFQPTTAPTFTGGTGPIVSGINYASPFAGSAAGTFDDNDNSGIMKYVSIRHSGAILAVGAEINGLTLASVGRGTTIDHIEIVSCADDNIEIFGGTVNLKYVSTLFGNDDMFDYDLGWKGKCQFFFGMKNTAAGTSPDNDNGIEADSHDNNSMTTFRSHPVLYNFTILGNAKEVTTADNRGLAGANFKDGAEGELYNSIFANFKNGINLAKSFSSPVTYNAWHNWRNVGTTESPNANIVAVANSLKIKCNTILMNSGTSNSNGLGIDATSAIGVSGAIATPATTAVGGELDQFLADGNIVTTAAIPGFSYAFTVNAATNVVSVKNDVTPNPALSIAGCPTVPVDGFFEPANYRGAFSSTGENWLSDWTYSQAMGATSGVAACPTDLNADGVTDVNDFLIFGPAFNTSCN